MPLDFDSFGDGQRIFKFNSEVSDRAVHLGVTEEKLNGAEVGGFQREAQRFKQT